MSITKRLALAVTLWWFGAAALAAPEIYATDKTKNIVGGRKVLFLMPQTRIENATDNSGWAALAGAAPYVAAFAALAQVIDGEETKNYGERLDQLRKSVQNYDFREPMQAALMPSIMGSNWLRAESPELTVDASSQNIQDVLNAADKRQMLLVTAGYLVDGKFRNIEVDAAATILVRRIPKGEYGDARLKPKFIPFQQRYHCLVYLPGSENGRAGENVARWSANDGALARRALDLGIRRVGEMIAQHLDGTRESVDVWADRGDRKTITRYGRMGWVVEKMGDSTKFYASRERAFTSIEILNP